MPALELKCVTKFAPPEAYQKHRPKTAIVVHGGARDGYQLALALSEAGLLEALVTDLFWAEDTKLARSLRDRLPSKWLSKLRQRSAPGLPSTKVHTCPLAGIGGLLLDKLPAVPFSARRRCIRSADATLGRTAGEEAKRNGAGLVSYSYYGYDAFRAYGRGGMLFQVHPHPATMRSILQAELLRYPECADSLKQEWELSLPEEDFEHLVEEAGMASQYLAASSFTRQSLVDNGVPEENITVIPYGVDLQRFRPDPAKRATRTSKLRLLFVGRINQRKGVKYLLEALRLLKSTNVELMICGRVLDDLRLFDAYRDLVEIRPNMSNSDLVRAYQSADLFVFPSVGEGFGQVLLESMACGLPILSTTHTAAPDLIDEGVQGFTVEPRHPGLLAEKIDWAASHRSELMAMGQQARLRAEHFTWERFRLGAACAVRSFLSDGSPRAKLHTEAA